MATKKINEDALILKAAKAVNKELGIADKTPAAKMKSFNEKVKQHQHLFYIVLKMFGKHLQL